MQESVTGCQLESPDHFYPTVAVAEGTEDGHIEIAASYVIRSSPLGLFFFIIPEGYISTSRRIPRPVVCRRFVANRTQALMIWRELFA